MVDDDARLMLAFRDGDRRAFEALFTRYTPRVLTFLTRMVRDRARAEELTQDVFVRIYNAASRYEANARFSTWIFGIARNLALNELARAHRRYEKPATELDLLRSADPAPGADVQLEGERARQGVERALAKLPERQRAALLLAQRAGARLRRDRIGAGNDRREREEPDPSRPGNPARGAGRRGRAMTCAERRAEFAAYLDGELGPNERSELASHLEGCVVCQAALDSERQLSLALGDLPPVELPPDFEARFWARIAHEQDAPKGWTARLLSRRLALGLGGAAAVAAAAVLMLRNRLPAEVEADLPIVASARDFELLEDPDLELIEVVDLLLEMEGDQG